MPIVLQSSSGKLFRLPDSQPAAAPRAAAVEGVELHLLLAEGLAPMLKSSSFWAAAAPRAAAATGVDLRLLPRAFRRCSNHRRLGLQLPLGPPAPTGVAAVSGRRSP
uniref:Uncharacterized protein n=1 Tax=Oryza meridionalis TaxID=40149 RepID=A0A0E0F5A8_9ORYZ